MEVLDVSSFYHKSFYSMFVRVLLLLLLVNKPAVHAADCTHEETNKMQEEFTKCTGEMTSNYQSNLEDGNLEEDTCNLFNSVINKCGDIWHQCNTEDEIQRIKNMQLEGLIGQYVYPGTVTLEECPLVTQYWEAEGLLEEDEEGSTEYCTDKQYTQTQTKFQTCSHTISTEVYQSFQDMTDPDLLRKTICDGLTKIQDTCPDLLKECFGPVDIKQMLNMHLKEIRRYLVSISSVEIAESSIDSCFVLEELNMDESYYEYYAPDEELADYSQEDVTEDRSADIQHILSEHQAQEPADQPDLDPHQETDRDISEQTKVDDTETKEIETENKEEAMNKEKKKREDLKEADAEKPPISKLTPRPQSSQQNLESSSSNANTQKFLLLSCILLLFRNYF